MILTILAVAQLQQPTLTGVELRPSYAITEPNDIQPAYGVNLYQRTFTPQAADPYKGGPINVLKNELKMSDVIKDINNGSLRWDK